MRFRKERLSPNSVNTETLCEPRRAVHKAGVVKAAAVAKQRNKKKKTWQLEDAFGSQEIQLVSQMNDFSHAPCLHKPSSAVGHGARDWFFLCSPAPGAGCARWEACGAVPSGEGEVEVARLNGCATFFQSAEQRWEKGKNCGVISVAVSPLA